MKATQIAKHQICVHRGMHCVSCCIMEKTMIFLDPLAWLLNIRLVCVENRLQDRYDA